MLNDRKNKKLKKLLADTNINDKDIENLSFKDKQKYYNAKSLLGRISFVSRDKDGNGITYKKPKDSKIVQNIRGKRK